MTAATADLAGIRQRIEQAVHPFQQDLSALEARREELKTELASTETLIREAERVVKALGGKNGGRRAPARGRARVASSRARGKKRTRMPRTERMGAVRRLLIENPSGLTATELQKETGWPVGTVRNAIVWMEKDRLLTRSGPKGRPTYRLR